MTKIKFTDRAKEQIEKIINEDKLKKFFRISVKGGGCSGFKYDFSFDDKTNEEDIFFGKAVIDKVSLDKERFESDQELLEKYAREEYLMKKESEDIFYIIKE